MVRIEEQKGSLVIFLPFEFCIVFVCLCCFSEYMFACCWALFISKYNAILI